MSTQGVTGMRALHAEIEPLLRALTAEEWAAPSACAGWRVQDVVAHMTATMKMIVDPDPMPAPEPGSTPPGAEAVAELMVAPRKAWPAEEVMAEYERYLPGFMGFLEAVQDEPVASAPNDLGDLGTHPTHIFSNVFCFDHYCHLTFDICAPHGPVDRPAPAPNPDVLGPAVEWMMGGLPAMCAADLGVVQAPLRIVFTGPGAQVWLVTPATEGSLVGVTPGDSTTAAAATVTTSAHDFVSWGTKRSDWRPSCTIEGDTALATAVLDVVNII